MKKLIPNYLLDYQGPILLEGESGAGKGHMAQRIHALSEFQDGPFVAVNIGGISNDLFLSELFGHSKGSFTGAARDQIGFCELANHGVLFLDEVSNLSFEAQGKLLTFLDHYDYYPVGSRKKQSFKGRIIFASNQDLSVKVAQGEFREDLYFRIAAFRYKLTPLREESSLKQIILSQFENYKVRYGHIQLQMTDCILELLIQYAWPGNYRELKSMMELIVVRSLDRQYISKSDLPENITRKESTMLTCENFHDAVAMFEKSFLHSKLVEHAGKVNRTASVLGLSKTTLIAKMKKYHLDYQGYRVAQKL